MDEEIKNPLDLGKVTFEEIEKQIDALDRKSINPRMIEEILGFIKYKNIIERRLLIEKLSKKTKVPISDLNSSLYPNNKTNSDRKNFGNGTRRHSILTRRGQLEEFYREHPYHYDENKIFWIWDEEKKCWIKTDEVHYCNLLSEQQQIDTLKSKEYAELVRGFQQVGRSHKPKKIEPTWVQFYDMIYDFKDDSVCLEAGPEYFVTNPIPFKLGKNENTPTIDKYFRQWMKGQPKSNIKLLYEIIAYCCITQKFLQRIIALVGGGANGKGTFVKMVFRFIGKGNYSESDIKSISENRFGASVLYKKLLCVFGEVSGDDLKNTNQLKKLAGEDELSFEFKGKDPFTEENTATAICLTNSLPITPDKTLGFFRRWLILDFLNQFKQIDVDLIGKIPDWEFENLARKSLRILRELYKNPHFTNEGSFEERMQRYEERSNPVMRFVDEYCIDEPGKKVSLREFTNACNGYFILNHLRLLTARQIGQILRNEGFEIGKRKDSNDISSVYVINLDMNNDKINEYKKTTETTRTTKKPNRNTHKGVNENNGSSGSSGSSGSPKISYGDKLKELLTIIDESSEKNITIERCRNLEFDDEFLDDCKLKGALIELPFGFIREGPDAKKLVNRIGGES